MKNVPNKRFARGGLVGLFGAHYPILVEMSFHRTDISVYTYLLLLLYTNTRSLRPNNRKLISSWIRRIIMMSNKTNRWQRSNRESRLPEAMHSKRIFISLRLNVCQAKIQERIQKKKHKPTHDTSFVCVFIVRNKFCRHKRTHSLHNYTSW